MNESKRDAYVLHFTSFVYQYTIKTWRVRMDEKSFTYHEGLVGEYVNAMGGKYHRSCFTCRVCDASCASKFIPHDGGVGRPSTLTLLTV